MTWPGSQAAAQTPDVLEDLVGVQVKAGEAQMKARGWQFVRISTSDPRWRTWWHPERSECVSAFVDKGRYASISREPPNGCVEIDLKIAPPETLIRPPFPDENGRPR